MPLVTPGDNQLIILDTTLLDEEAIEINWALDSVWGSAEDFLVPDAD